ncbi:transposable element Tcb1 transposase [Elysia marginata]|uniref:Transposable element Tcb1 transposase n=1 Tax=Elysia marginata TaxID=1093978 RepID=A0AAV4EBN0_9GAST|nr:transposable element Tcb1 transposase [Elysia marginata]
MCFRLTWCLTPPCIEIIIVFQQGNARAHTARYTQQFLEQSNVQDLPWPALSPDLNPIEHLWDYLQRRLDCQDHRLQNADEGTGMLFQDIFYIF